MAKWINLSIVGQAYSHCGAIFLEFQIFSVPGKCMLRGWFLTHPGWGKPSSRKLAGTRTRRQIQAGLVHVPKYSVHDLICLSDLVSNQFFRGGRTRASQIPHLRVGLPAPGTPPHPTHFKSASGLAIYWLFKRNPIIFCIMYI